MNMLNLPKKVYFKDGSAQVALRELNEVYHLKRAFLVSDPRLYRSGLVLPIDRWLRARGIRTAEFFSIGSPPSFDEIRSALPKLLEFEPDVIVGIGGGAAMSAAKALWALYEDPRLDPEEAVESPERIRTGDKAKLVLVATSFGSGAQTSPFALLKDSQGAPRVMNSFRLLPEIAVTDAQFTRSLSSAQVRACGLATLARAIRALLSGECGEYARGLLLEAAGLVLKHLRAAESGCPAAREALHNAAALTGAACGSAPPALLEPAPPWPTAAEKTAEGTEELAQELGFSGARELREACEALR